MYPLGDDTAAHDDVARTIGTLKYARTQRYKNENMCIRVLCERTMFRTQQANHPPTPPTGSSVSSGPFTLFFGIVVSMRVGVVLLLLLLLPLHSCHCSSPKRYHIS